MIIPHLNNSAFRIPTMMKVNCIEIEKASGLNPALRRKNPARAKIQDGELAIFPSQDPHSIMSRKYGFMAFLALSLIM